MKNMKRFFWLRACCAFAAVLLCAFLLEPQALADDGDNDADEDYGDGDYRPYIGSVLTPSGPIDPDAVFDKKFFDLCRSGSAAEVKAAIDAGANLREVNDAGETPLLASCSNPDREVYKLIYKAKFGKFGL